MFSKRVISAFLFFFISLTLFSGCAPKEEGENIVVWHWMSDRQDAFQGLAEKYEQETGVKVKFEVFFPPDIYMQKIQAAAAARDLPDLFGILEGKKIFSDFIEAGYIANLKSEMEADNKAWLKRFIPITVAVNSFEEGNVYGTPEGIYAVPIDTMSMQFLYNTELLEKAGFNPGQPPQDWETFISMAKEIKEKLKVEGFVCGWGESWLIYTLVTNYAFNVMGEEKFIDTMAGKVPYTDPDWVKVFSLFQDMVDAGILAPGIVTLSNKEAEQMFSMNQAVFSFNGSWGMNTYAQMNPDLKYDTMLPPQLGDEHKIKIWAGAGSSFMVNPDSELKSGTIDFLKWFTAKDQQLTLMQETKNLPSVVLNRKEIPDFLGKFLKHMDQTTHQNLWPLNEHPRVVEAINVGVQKLLVGQKTPEQLAADVEKAKQNVSKNK